MVTNTSKRSHLQQCRLHAPAEDPRHSQHPVAKRPALTKQTVRGSGTTRHPKTGSPDRCRPVAAATLRRTGRGGRLTQRFGQCSLHVPGGHLVLARTKRSPASPTRSSSSPSCRTVSRRISRSCHTASAGPVSSRPPWIPPSLGYSRHACPVGHLPWHAYSGLGQGTS